MAGSTAGVSARSRGSRSPALGAGNRWAASLPRAPTFLPSPFPAPLTSLLLRVPPRQATTPLCGTLALLLFSTQQPETLGLLPPSESGSKVSAAPRPLTHSSPRPPCTRLLPVFQISAHTQLLGEAPHHLPKGPLSLRHSRSSLSEPLSRFQAIVFASTCLGYSSHYIQAPEEGRSGLFPTALSPPPGVPGSPRPHHARCQVLAESRRQGPAVPPRSLCQGPRQSPVQRQGGRASSNTQTQGEVTFPSLKQGCPQEPTLEPPGRPPSGRGVFDARLRGL